MATLPRISFTAVLCGATVFITFEHRTRGDVTVLVEHDNGSPVDMGVLLEAGIAPIEILGADYAEALIEIAAQILVRVAA